MDDSLSFEQLAGVQEDAPDDILQNESVRKGMQVDIDVAGPKGVTPKTFVLSLDNMGLIRVRFQEGGKLPALLNGRFTGISDVRIALATYQEREAKHFHVNEEVSRSQDLGVTVGDMLEKAQQDAPPKFDEKLDPALEGDMLEGTDGEYCDLTEDEGSE